MDKYVMLAKNTIDSYIREGKIYRPADEELTDEMRNERAGAFVSIHEDGDLRGCIGTIAATRDTLADEIVSNAISASTRDPRFPPITEPELEKLRKALMKLAEETGHSYETVLRCALDLSNYILREASLHAH